jgi:hypothetical protein
MVIDRCLRDVAFDDPIIALQRMANHISRYARLSSPFLRYVFITSKNHLIYGGEA